VDRRRGQRIGYLFKKNGSWWLQYRDYAKLRPNKAGKMVPEHPIVHIGACEGPGKLTEKQAQRLAWDEYLSKADQVTKYPASKQTIADFVAESFIPGLVETLKPGGKGHYAYMLNKHVLPALGKMQLRELQPLHVQKFLALKLKAGLSVQTALHIKNTISAIFRYAKSMRAYSGDLPTEGVRLPELHVAPRQVMTHDQVRQLADALPEQVSILVTVLAETGMRIGEAMGLRWKCVRAKLGNC
jgi:integrase